jgi:hypothetical protein
MTTPTATLAALTATIKAMEKASGKNSPDFHAAFCAHFVALDALTAASSPDWNHRADVDQWQDDFAADFEEVD